MKEYLFKCQSEDGINRSALQKIHRENQDLDKDLVSRDMEIKKSDHNVSQDEFFVSKQENQIRSLEKYLRELDGGRSVLSYMDSSQMSEPDYNPDLNFPSTPQRPTNDTPFRKHTKETAIKNTFIEDNKSDYDDFQEILAEASDIKLSKDRQGLDNRNFSLKEYNDCLKAQLDC